MEKREEWRLPKWVPSGKPGAAEGTQLRGTWQGGGENLKSKEGGLDHEFSLIPSAPDSVYIDNVHASV